MVSLEKAIKSGQEYRKPYQGSKRFDRTCRNHGSCSYCAERRQHKHKRRKPTNEGYDWQTGHDPVFLRLVIWFIKENPHSETFWHRREIGNR